MTNTPAAAIRRQDHHHSYTCFLDGHIVLITTSDKDRYGFETFQQWFEPSDWGSKLQYLITSALVSSALISPTYAVPQGFQVISGDVQFNQSGNTLNVTSTTNQAVVHYQSFNINQGQTVNFNLPSSTASILNQVVGSGSTTIAGTLNSNGTVLLTNPNGIRVADTGQVNAGSFLASTLQMSPESYAAKDFRLEKTGTAKAVVNEGTIQAGPGGFVVLSGSAVNNTGNIFADSVHLVTGDQIRIQLSESHKVDVTVDEGLQEAVADFQEAIHNSGTIEAHKVELLSKLERQVYQQAVNQSGVIRAAGIVDEGGVIRIVSQAELDAGPATVTNTGTLTASSTDSSTAAGTVHIEGPEVEQQGVVLAEGSTGQAGGDITVTSTEKTTLATGSVTSARGKGADSSAGEILIWSDGDTHFESQAIVDVQGGDISGDGGFVEVSGADELFFSGTAKGGATDGEAGSILLDPTNIIIQNTGTDTATDSAGIDVSFTDDAGNTVSYDPSASGTFDGFGDVHLQATNDITVNDAFDLQTATGNAGASVKLEANRNIVVNDSLTTSGGTIDLVADADGNNSGQVQINANVASAGGDITLEGSRIDINTTVDAGSGDITILPSRNKQIYVVNGGNDDNNRIRLSNAELDFLEASDVVIGSLGFSNDTVVTGDLDISGLGYDLTLRNSRNVLADERQLISGTNAINFEAGNEVRIRNRQTNHTVDVGSIKASRVNVEVTRTGTDFNASGNIEASSYLRLDADAGNISVGGNIIQTGGNTTELKAGDAGASHNYSFNVGGTVQLADSTSNRTVVELGGGNLLDKIQPVSVREFELITKSNTPGTVFSLPQITTTERVLIYQKGENHTLRADNAITAGTLLQIQNEGIGNSTIIDATVRSTGNNTTYRSIQRDSVFEVTTDGQFISDNNNVVIRTDQTNSSIDLDGAVTAGQILDVLTYGTNSSVTGDGNLTTLNNRLRVQTEQTDNTITLNGNITSATRLEVIGRRNRTPITLNGTIESLAGDRITLQTLGQDSPLTLNGLVRALDPNTNIGINTNQVRSNLTVNNNITAGRFLELRTNRDNSALTVNGDLTSNTNSVFLYSARTGSPINFTGNITANNRAEIRTNSTNSGITVTGNLDANLNEVNVETRNDDSPITVVGNLTSTNHFARVYARQDRSAIQVTGNLTGRNHAQIRTDRTLSPITLQGDLTSTNSYTELRTRQVNSSINAVGDLNSQAQSNIYTEQANSPINFTGDITTQSNRIYIDGRRDNSSVFVSGNFDATGDAIFQAKGTGSDLTVNGTVESGGRTQFYTDGLSNDILVTADVTAGNTLEFRTRKNESSITATGNLSTNNNIAIRTDRDDSPISLTGTFDAQSTNSIYAYGHRSDITLDGDFTARGNNRYLDLYTRRGTSDIFLEGSLNSEHQVRIRSNPTINLTGELSIVADSDNSNAGNFEFNRNIDTNDNNLSIQTSRIDINRNIDASNAVLTITPSANKAVRVGHTQDNADSNTRFDLSNQEISRIQASELSVGSDQFTGDTTLQSTFNINTVSDKLTLKNGGTVYIPSGHTFNKEIELVAGQSITLPDFNSSEELTVTSHTGDITITDDINTPKTVTLSAGDDITSNPGADITTSANLHVTAGDDIELQTLQAADITIQSTGGDIELEETVTADNLTVTAFDEIETEKALNIAIDASFTSQDGDIDFNDTVMANTITANAHQDLTVSADLTATTDMDLTSAIGDVIVNGELNGATVDINASTALTVNSAVIATGDTTLETQVGDVTLNNTVSGDNVTVEAADDLTVNQTVTGAGNTTLDTQTGDVDINAAVQGDSVTVTASNDLTVDNTVTATTGDTTLSTQAGTLTVSDTVTGDDVTITAAADLTVDQVVTGTSDTSLSSQTGSVTVNNIVTGDTITVNADDAVTVNNDLTATSSAAITATQGDVTVAATVDGGDLITVEATQGSIVQGANGLLTADEGTLTAGTIIGTLDDPLDVNITDGPLVVTARDFDPLNGISVNIIGSVTPSNTLTEVIGDQSPGAVLFNGRSVRPGNPVSAALVKLPGSSANGGASPAGSSSGPVTSGQSTASNPNQGSAFVQNQASPPPRVNKLNNEQLVQYKAQSDGGVVQANTSSGDTLFRINNHKNSVQFIAMDKREVVDEVPLSGSPRSIAYDNQRQRLYVTQETNNSVAVIDTNTRQKIGEIQVGNRPRSIHFNEETGQVYVANFGDNTVSVINSGAQQTVSTIAVGQKPTSVTSSPDGQHVYVSNYQSGSVSVIDSNSLQAVKEIATPSGPRKVVFASDSEAYVLNFLDQSVSQIDPTSLTLTKTRKVSGSPFSASHNTQDNTLVVAFRENDHLSLPLDQF